MAAIGPEIKEALHEQIEEFVPGQEAGSWRDAIGASIGKNKTEKRSRFCPNNFKESSLPNMKTMRKCTLPPIDSNSLKKQESLESTQGSSNLGSSSSPQMWFPRRRKSAPESMEEHANEAL